MVGTLSSRSTSRSTELEPSCTSPASRAACCREPQPLRWSTGSDHRRPLWSVPDGRLEPRRSSSPRSSKCQRPCGSRHIGVARRRARCKRGGERCGCDRSASTAVARVGTRPVNDQIGSSTASSSIDSYVARRLYSLVREPQAASATHSGSSYAGWSGSTSTVMVNRYRRMGVSMSRWSLEKLLDSSNDR